MDYRIIFDTNGRPVVCEPDGSRVAAPSIEAAQKYIDSGTTTLLAAQKDKRRCECGRGFAVVRNPVNRTACVCWYCWHELAAARDAADDEAAQERREQRGPQGH